jgi:hypothetical protein
LDKKTPEYPLELICTAAREGKVSYVGRAQTDAINLGYSDEDVATCLCTLSESDFVETKEYLSPNGQKKFLCDVYKVKCVSPQNGIDDLYIKLRYRIWTVVVSFHLNRHL